MVKDDMEAAKPKETLESPNPDGKKDGDASNLGGPGDSQVGERGPRVSAEEEGGGGDDDMSVTLAQLSSKRAGKKLKAAAAKEGGDAGFADEKTEDTSGGDGDSVTLRRSRRNRNNVDPGDETKKLKVDEDGEMMQEERKLEDEEDEDEEDEESEFSVGDFVWGKVKSHPWWPGRVFDPSDASQQALKYKHEGRILVAYFGDATFAWCDPSQLKPFVENFAEMSKQSGSKSFVNAVEEAVSEFGRLVELDMTCYCTPRSELSDHHQTSALNAGIKGGVNVNKGGIGIYSVDRFNPAAFLADLRIVGNHASVPNLLELTTLKSWVSAVYRSKDGPLLLKFNELQEAAADEGVGAGIEDSMRGPVEEPVQVVPGMSDALGPAKRKERSVAEILYGDEKGNNEDGAVVEGEKGVKTDLKSGRKKRKVADGNQMKTADQEESLGDESLVTQSGKRKKKSDEAPKGETNHGDKPEDEKKEGRRSSRMKVAKGSLKPVVVIESDLAALEDSEMSPRTRERKKSKYLSPPYTNLEYYRQTAMTSPRGPAETKAVESSLVSQSGETSSKRTPASAQVSGYTPLVSSGETSKKKLPKEDGKPNGSAPATPRRASSRKVGGNPTLSVTSSNNVLSGIQSAALSGRLSKGDRSLNAVKGFLTSYRSSKYHNVSGCNPSEADNQSEGKGESTLGLDHEVVNEERKSVKKLTKHDKAKLKSKAKVVDSEKDGKITGTPISAALHLKFPPDHPLPSKDDLGALFGKFGALEASKTKVSQKSSSARLVFVRSSDAEEACKSSKASSSPFGAAEVTYRIRNLRGTSVEKEADENGFSKKDSTNPASQKRKRPSKKQSLASVSNGGLRLVKQKLEGMATMVAEAGDGKMSSKIKSDLENRLKDLLDEVKALPASPMASGTGV